MTWEQKIQAAQALGPELSLRMLAPGNWYVRSTLRCDRNGALLRGAGNHFCSTPEDAVNQYWDWLTNPAFYVVAYYLGVRKAVRWNGFMWADVDEKAVAAA